MDCFILNYIPQIGGGGGFRLENKLYLVLRKQTRMNAAGLGYNTM
jgi:hypothetical protein